MPLLLWGKITKRGRNRILDSEEIAQIVARIALEKKAKDILVLNLKNLLVITDYFVICSGNTDKQLKRIAESVKEKLGRKGISPIGTEGEDGGSWILLDYGGVVTHIFTESQREYYQLERLWKDAPKEIYESEL